MEDSHTTLIEALRNPALYDHPVAGFTVVETHISWVILTGEYAYKIKKPVDLGFLDFSTLEKRRFYCEEELRLNRRLAPRLYLAVVAITGDARRPALNGPGPIIEYAVKMRQFDPDQQFDRLLARGRLPAECIDEVATQMAAFHDKAATATMESPYGSPDAVWEPVAENHAQILPLLSHDTDIARLEALQAWFASRRDRHAALIRQRKAANFVRECHGDLHLANIALFEGAVVIFDCLEFNDRLRWIDVISDAAFLMMDLESRNQRPLAWRFLNEYLQHTGDYEALPLLPYYLAYRAMVRAKVALIRTTQTGQDDARASAHAEFRTYLSQAERYARPTQPALLITHGLSGAGKTTISRPLAEHLGAVRLRSDVERKRLFGLESSVRAATPPGTAIYTPDATERTYERLAKLAAIAIEAGFPVIVDATFLQGRQRAAFRALAEHLRVPFLILHCHAPEALLRQWIRERQAAAQDASDADLEVLDHQLTTQEPVTEEEASWVLDVDTAQAVDCHALYQAVKRRLFKLDIS